MILKDQSNRCQCSSRNRPTLTNKWLPSGTNSSHWRSCSVLGLVSSGNGEDYSRSTNHRGDDKFYNTLSSNYNASNKFSNLLLTVPITVLHSIRTQVLQLLKKLFITVMLNLLPIVTFKLLKKKQLGTLLFRLKSEIN